MSLIETLADHPTAWIFGAAAALILGVTVIPDLSKALNRREFEVRVTKGSVKGNEEGNYFIWANSIPPGEPRVFEDVDNWFAGKVNSSYVYGKLKVGQTYRVQTAGWRWQLMSTYENIVKVEEMEESQFRADSAARWGRHF
jgi:hypothetical protein